ITSALTTGGLSLALLPLPAGGAFLVFEGPDSNFYWTQYSGGAWSAVAPVASSGFSSPAGSGNPVGFALDTQGDLFVTDSVNNATWEYTWTGSSAIGSTSTLPWGTPVQIPATL